MGVKKTPETTCKKLVVWSGMSEGLMKLKVGHKLINDESDHAITFLPDTLIEYAKTHPQKLKESTKYSYRHRWDQQIKIRPETLFVDKVHALALWITQSFETGLYSDSTYRQFKATFCFVMAPE